MVEETSDVSKAPSVSNKKLLITALVLAAVVVLLYNFHMRSVRKASRGETVQLLRFVRDMRADERIERKDLEVVELELEYAKGLGNYLTRDKLSYAVSSTLNQPIRKGRWLLFDHTIVKEESNPSARIKLRMVKYSFPIDSEQSPVEMLREGDRVNVLGMFTVGRNPLQAYRVIENVKVMEVPSKRKVTLEVTPEVAKQLANIRTHARGSLWVEVRNPTEGGGKAEIHSELRKLTAAPSTGRRARSLEQ